MSNSNDVIKDEAKERIKNVEKTFVLACLCHDVGHSPFSHTGEKFYDVKKINKELVEVVNQDSFSSALEDGRIVVGKEHEIMSALLAINKFGDIIEKNNFELFARCIIGLQYKDDSTNSFETDNIAMLHRACVELLNSDIIDVDKLDYLIRDSYMSGYASVSIDYQRLLQGVFINKGSCPIGYEKSSLSVLETVLTAHDMERRWIQSHPVIQYESFLIQTIIREISSEYSDSSKKNQELFSLEALTETGVKIETLGAVRLLSDADILYFAKQIYTKSDAVKEYFDRGSRRHPIWKSEAEFSLVFDFKRNNVFIEMLKKWERDLLEGKYGVYSLNENFVHAIEKERKEFISKKASMTLEAQKNTIDITIEKLDKELGVLKKIREYLSSKNIPFDIVIVSQQQFKRNIYKESFRKLPIRFNRISGDITEKEEVTSVPFYFEKEKPFFYLYYKKTEGEILDIRDFSIMLSTVAMIR